MTTQQAGSATRTRWALGLLLIGCVLAVFFPALSNGYVWDDHIFFDEFRVDVYFASWWANGREPFSISANYFRPVAMLSFLADFAAGSSATASHLINLSFHALNAALVGLLAWRLLSIPEKGVAPWTALAAGLWYGLHPALIEPAAWVACRFDLVMTTCSLLLLHVSLTTARWVWPAITLLFLAALFSKESAAGLLVAWPGWVAAVAALRGRLTMPAVAGPLVRGWGALGVGLLLDVVIRFWARGYAWVFGDSGLGDGAYLERIAMSVAQQIRLMVLPFGAVDPFHTAARFDSVSYLVAVGVVGAAGFWATRPATRPWAALVLAGIAALAPTSNVIPIEFAGGVYTADRYLTLPLVFLAPVVAAALQWAWARLPSTRRLAAALLAVWLVGAVALVRTTLPLMRDDIRFWGWVARLHPDEVVAQNNLADALILGRRFPEAIQVLAQALETNPGVPWLWHNLARAHDGLGQRPQAMAAIDRAIAIGPPNENFWRTKAAIVARTGDLETAERIVRERVLVINPGLVEAHLYLIRLMLATGRTAEAESYVHAHGDVFTGERLEQALELISTQRAGHGP
jgi:hypothetical protein